MELAVLETARINMSTFVVQQGEEVSLVGDFTGDWTQPVRLVHKGGPRYEAELKISHGR